MAINDQIGCDTFLAIRTRKVHWKNFLSAELRRDDPQRAARFTSAIARTRDRFGQLIPSFATRPSASGTVVFSSIVPANRPPVIDPH